VGVKYGGASVEEAELMSGSRGSRSGRREGKGGCMIYLGIGMSEDWEGRGTQLR